MSFIGKVAEFLVGNVYYYFFLGRRSESCVYGGGCVFEYVFVGVRMSIWEYVELCMGVRVYGSV